MKNICVILMFFLCTFPSLAQKADEHSQWDKDYEKAIDILEAKYPDVLDDNSTFTNELDRRLAEAKKNADPIMQKPECVLLLADKLAEDFKKISIPVKRGVEKPLVGPKATELPSAIAPSARPLNDIEKYIEQAKAGRAGQNPKDVTDARSGDPAAQARVNARDRQNQTNKLSQDAVLSDTAIEIRRIADNAAYQQELQAIENERLRQQYVEQQRQMQEAQRLMQQRNYELERLRQQQWQQKKNAEIKRQNYQR